MDSNPVAPSERYELADQYNKQLRERLSTPPPAEKRDIVARLSFAPMVSTRGGGLGLGLSF
jgi:hypothetical protein